MSTTVVVCGLLLSMTGVCVNPLTEGETATKKWGGSCSKC